MEITPLPPRRPALRTRSSAPTAFLVALLVSLVLVGCSGGERPTLEAVTTSAPTSTSTAVTQPEVPPYDPTAPLGPDNLLGYIATPIGEPVVHSLPDPSSPTIEVPATTNYGAPTTFAVAGTGETDENGWLRVALPGRPNGSTGFVDSSVVTLTRTSLRGYVDLEARTMRLEDSGAEIFSADIAIGSDEYPTPAGAVFVTELVENVDPTNAYGPYAFGLSLHSDQITEFGEGGDGQVGIHGTNRPDLIGQAVSHGCVRLSNDSIQELVELAVPLGMPIFIV